MDKEFEETTNKKITELSSPSSEVGITIDMATARYQGTVDHENILSILQATASYFATTVPHNSRSGLIKISNSEEAQKNLNEILSMHFYSMKLSNLNSVIVFLLLNFFLLWRDLKENERAKKLYEDHIVLLKEKNSDLEQKIKDEKEISQCRTCDELKQSVDSLSEQCRKLKLSYNEVCHVNEQWALDYDTLAKQITNATGFHSETTTGLHSTATSSSTHSSSTTSSNHPPTHFMSDPSCVHCHIYKSQLDIKNQEIEELQAVRVGLQEDIKEYKERSNQKQRELQSLENEFHTLRIQIQEIGDLQQTLSMKQDYRKMQRSLQQKTKLYQEAMCEKMELQKQIEKLRQAFLKFFPGANTQPHHMTNTVSTGTSTQPSMSTRPLSGGYYSFPLQSCSHNIYQSHTTENNPPTPPGLIARGDFKGAHMEKDQDLVPKNKRHPSNGILHPDSRDSSYLSWPTEPTLYHSIPDSHMTDHMITNTNGIGPSKFDSNLSQEFVVMDPNSILVPTRHSNQVKFHSNNQISHSGSNYPSTTSSLSQSSISIPHNSAILSSLGYASNDQSITDLSFASPSYNHAPYPLRSKSSLATYLSSETEYSSNLPSHDTKSLSQNDIRKQNIGQTLTRPKFLSLNTGSTGFGVHQLSGRKQIFSCPNCKKAFASNQGGFDPWFEHMKYCSRM